MPNYELTKDGMVTSDPVIAAMFLGENCTFSGFKLSEVEYSSTYGYWFVDEKGQRSVSITIPCAALKSAITPVEGERCVFNYDSWAGWFDDNILIQIEKQRIEEGSPISPRQYHWHVLLFCETRGELRELLAAIERWE